MKGRPDVRPREVLSVRRADGTALPAGQRLRGSGGLLFLAGEVRYTATRFSDFSKRRQTTGLLCKMSRVLNDSDYNLLCGQPKHGHGWNMAHKPPILSSSGKGTRSCLASLVLFIPRSVEGFNAS